MPWRVASGGVAAALVLSVVVAFTPQGSSAAASFLAQFRSQQVSAIEITPQSQADILRSMNALGNLGTVQVPGAATAGQPQAVARQVAAESRTVTPAQAAQTVGFALATPDPATLPAGLSTTPTVKVSPASQVRFTFDKAKAQAYYQSTGHPEVSLPDKFNGAALSVSIPSAALLSYGSGGTSKDELVVVEAGELVVDVAGQRQPARDARLPAGSARPATHGREPAAANSELERHAAHSRPGRQGQLAVDDLRRRARVCC